MTLAENLRHITCEEYLEGEKCSDVRHEHVAGGVYALIAANGLRT